MLALPPVGVGAPSALADAPGAAPLADGVAPAVQAARSDATAINAIA
jgi:hypothetical protein